MTTAAIRPPDLAGFVEAATKADNLTPQDLADIVVGIQDTIAQLRLLETDFAAALGRAEGACEGYVSDGRRFTLKRTPDRKEWDHESWRRDVRRAVVRQATDDRQLVVLDSETGETKPLGEVLHTAITQAQEVHGSAYPRSGALRGLGLYSGDYCTSSPGAWRLTAVRPEEKPEAVTGEAGAR